MRLLYYICMLVKLRIFTIHKHMRLPQFSCEIIIKSKVCICCALLHGHSFHAGCSQHVTSVSQATGRPTGQCIGQINYSWNQQATCAVLDTVQISVKIVVWLPCGCSGNQFVYMVLTCQLKVGGHSKPAPTAAGVGSSNGAGAMPLQCLHSWLKPQATLLKPWPCRGPTHCGGGRGGATIAQMTTKARDRLAPGCWLAAWCDLGATLSKARMGLGVGQMKFEHQPSCMLQQVQKRCCWGPPCGFLFFYIC